jgi:Domain of unknown function (DUF4288)
LSSIEERVVLFRARTGESALNKGRAEAEKYAKEVRMVNVYGQQLKSELLPYIEAYELFEEPGNGVEVFSSLEITRSSESSRRIITRKIGTPAGASTARMFIAGRITKDLEDRLGKW